MNKSALLDAAAYLLCLWVACAWFDDHGWRFWKW